MKRTAKKGCLFFVCVVLCSVLCCACKQKIDLVQESTEQTTETAMITEQTIPDVSDVKDVDEVLKRLIEDEGFRERVRYGVGICEKDSPEEVLRKLETCERIILEEAPYGDAIYSLESLVLFPNLKSLVIDISAWDDSDITDFTPIAQLSHLEEITISYDKDKQIDLSFLGGMHTITGLFLTRCDIFDFSFLEQMPQLQYLSFYETPIDDLVVLERLPELVELALSGNENAMHIEAVGTLKKMQNLGMQYCGIKDIGFLSGLTELQNLNLNGNFIKDITPLASLEKLERLGLSDNKISDISALEGLKNLYDLAMDNNEIRDISVLTGLEHLNQVGISNNQIADLSSLADKRELIYAAVFGNPLESIKPVWEVPMLWFANQSVSDEERVCLELDRRIQSRDGSV